MKPYRGQLEMFSVQYPVHTLLMSMFKVIKIIRNRT